MTSEREHADARHDVPSTPAFRALYEAESSYLWNTLRRFGVHGRDLEDVSHDVFVKVYRNLSAYDQSRPLRPWLFGIAFRVASDYRRRAQHRNEMVGVETGEKVDEGLLPDQELARKRAQQTVMSALEAVKLERRAVFMMHDLDGFSIPEIARTLSVPLNTAYSRLRLARREFTAEVKRIRLRRGAA